MMPPFQPKNVDVESSVVDAVTAARLLNVSESTLYRLTDPRGPIMPVRIRRRVFYSRESIAAFLREQQQPQHNVLAPA